MPTFATLKIPLSLKRNDRRTLDEVVRWLLENHYLPSFCTPATAPAAPGDRLWSLAKNGAIADFCQANAILTMKEYLCDYASPKTLVEGEQVIQLELPKVKNEKFRNASVKTS